MDRQRSEVSFDERVAFEVVAAITGATVEPYDVDGRNRAVDALVHWPSGGAAALEVTRLTSQAHHQVETILARENFVWKIPELRWWWTARVHEGTRLDRLRGALKEMLCWFEQNQIEDPGRTHAWRGLPGAEEVRRSLNRCGASFFAYPDVGERSGQVMILPAARAGFTGDMTKVPRWLSEEIRSNHVTRKVAKLADSGWSDQHLYLIVDIAGAPFAAFDAMAFGDGVPDEDPDLPASLSAVWIAPRWSRAVLTWHRSRGWAKHWPYEPDQGITL